MYCSDICQAVGQPCCGDVYQILKQSIEYYGSYRAITFQQDYLLTEPFSFFSPTLDRVACTLQQRKEMPVLSARKKGRVFLIEPNERLSQRHTCESHFMPIIGK